MRFISSFAAIALIAAPAAAPAQNLGSMLGGIPGLGSVGVGNAAGLLGYCVKNKLLGSAGLGGTGLGGSALGGLTGATRTTGAAGAAGTAATAASGGGAAGILGALTGRKDVTSSPGYLLGQQGKVEQPGGGASALSLGGLSGQLKNKACDVVLKRAGSFL